MGSRKPADMGIGVFSVPEESWPQVNEQKEEALAHALEKLSKDGAVKAMAALQKLEEEHAPRRQWVWFELGKSPLADALHHLAQMASRSLESYSADSIESLKQYYSVKGYAVDKSYAKSPGCCEIGERQNTG